MTSWINFVKEYANDNNISYKQALIDAREDYKISKSIEQKINKKPRKVKLNIIEPEPITRPKIEPPPVQTKELKETTVTKEEPIKKKRKPRAVNLIIEEPEPIIRPKIEPPPVQTKELKETFDYKLKLNERKKKLTKKQKLKKTPNYPPSIVEEDESIEEAEPEKKIPPLVSKQEDELMKTTIPKLKEILKELNFTKFSKFKKQDYIDKILELKNIPKGVWWRYKYPWLYQDLQQLYSYLDYNSLVNITRIKNKSQNNIDKLEELKKSTITGEERRMQMRSALNRVERDKKHIKEFEKLSNIDFDKEIKKLEDEEIAQKKRFEDANKPQPIRRPAIEPPPIQTRQLKETTITTNEFLTPAIETTTNPNFEKEKKNLILKYNDKKRDVMENTKDDKSMRTAMLLVLKHNFNLEYKQLENKYSGKQSNAEKKVILQSISDID